MPSRRSILLPPLIGACLLLAGCAKSNEDQIRDTADAVATAGEQGDYASACAYAAPQLLSRYGGVPGCAAAMAAQVKLTNFDFHALHIASVSVLGQAGVIVVDSPLAFQVAVQKVNGHWLVTGL